MQWPGRKQWQLTIVLMTKSTAGPADCQETVIGSISHLISRMVLPKSIQTHNCCYKRFGTCHFNKNDKTITQILKELTLVLSKNSNNRTLTLSCKIAKVSQ